MDGQVKEGTGALGPEWQPAQCRVGTLEGGEVSRVYLGSDGFMVPLVTEQEKGKRREKGKRKRQDQGRKGKRSGDKGGAEGASRFRGHASGGRKTQGQAPGFLRAGVRGRWLPLEKPGACPWVFALAHKRGMHPPWDRDAGFPVDRRRGGSIMIPSERVALFGQPR
jgi:hypothetical protein